MTTQDWKDVAQELPEDDRNVIIATSSGQVVVGFYDTSAHEPRWISAYDEYTPYLDDVLYWQEYPAHPSKLAEASEVVDSEPIHEWFGLSYAQYLTIPRSALQSMSVVWQRALVKLLNELDGTIDWQPAIGRRYQVSLWTVNENAVFDGDPYWLDEIDDPLADYERGRRRLLRKTGDTNDE